MAYKKEGDPGRRGNISSKERAHASRRIQRKETHLDVPGFTPEQRRALEDRGYILFALTGQTIASLRDTNNPMWSSWHTGKSLEMVAEHPFWSGWHLGKPLESIPSIRTEVAINPDALFLPNSNGKTMDEQLALVAAFGKKMGEEIPGTTAIIGSVADYAELTFAHLTQSFAHLTPEDFGKFGREQKKNRLFGPCVNFNSTRTTTPVRESEIAFIGNFNADIGIAVGYLDPADTRGYIWAAPLVIPTAAAGRK